MLDIIRLISSTFSLQGYLTRRKSGFQFERNEDLGVRACVCVRVCVYLLMYVCECTLGSVDFIVHSARVSKDFVSSFSLESVDEQFLDSGSETELLLSISLCISNQVCSKIFF